MLVISCYVPIKYPLSHHFSWANHHVLYPLHYISSLLTWSAQTWSARQGTTASARQGYRLVQDLDFVGPSLVFDRHGYISWYTHNGNFDEGKDGFHPCNRSILFPIFYWIRQLHLTRAGLPLPWKPRAKRCRAFPLAVGRCLGWNEWDDPSYQLVLSGEIEATRPSANRFNLYCNEMTIIHSLLPRNRW